MYKLEYLGAVIPTIACVMIVLFVVRQKLTRFVLLKRTYVVFYLAMAVFFFVDMLPEMFPSERVMSYMWNLRISAFLVAAILMGNAVAVYRDPMVSTTEEYIREYLANPYYSHLFYTAVMVLGVLLTWLTNPYESVGRYVVNFKPWYLVNILPILVLAILFPPALQLKRCYELRDKRVDKRLAKRVRVMVLGWALLGVVLIVFGFLTAYFASEIIHHIGYIVALVPLVLIAYTFKEPEWQ
jgi:hypothetical protein